MAEESASLSQRVDALEQISHARAVERVGQVEQRVSRIESAREAEEPHVATKEDVARLETLVVDTRSELRGEIGDSRTEAQGSIGDLKEQIGDVKLALETKLRHLLMWLVGSAIALAAVIITATVFIVSHLS